MLKKRLLAVALCALTAACAMTACGKDIDVSDGSSSSTSEKAAPENVDIANYTAPEKGDTIIEMNIKDYGTVKIRLFPEYADKGVENFIGLAEKGYYDGLTFHRVIKDFMIQGGDPMGTGKGGESMWGGQFDGGTNNHLVHAAGALAYANSGSTSTDGSQFYIVTGTQNITDDTFSSYEQSGYSFSDSQKDFYKQNGGAPFLDGNYTVFGQVYDGLDVIFKIQSVKTDDNDKPVEDVIIESMTVEEYDGSPLKWHISDYEGAESETASDAEETSEAEAGTEETTEKTTEASSEEASAAE